ncbi:MAG: phage major capsid protein [Clostridia bacterium]|nr:phage major capsid protein [Clostridia bacterium]
MANIISRSNAEALIPTEQSREVISAVLNSSSALSLMRKLPNMTSKQKKLPIVSALPVAGFVEGDNGLKAVSSAAWTNKYITAEEIAVIIPIPEAVLDDADYDIWAEIKPSIISEFGRIIDGAVFFGTDKPTSWPDGIVTSAIAKNKTITFGEGADIAEDINGVMGLVEADGFDVSGFVGEIGLKSSLRGLRDKNGGLIFQPSLTAGTPSTIYGQPVSYVKNSSWNSAKAKLIAGDWSQAVYSIRQDITYKVLDQAVISDGEGKIIYNLAQQDMVALRCVMRLGWQLPNPITQLNQTENRYPFALLVPQGG